MRITNLSAIPQRRTEDAITRELITHPACVEYKTEIDGQTNRVILSAGAETKETPLLALNMLNAGSSIAAGSDVSRIDFDLSSYSVAAKVGGKLEKFSPCYKCPKTGSVLDTDIDAAEINSDLKAMAKAVYACDGGKYKEINGLMLEEDQPDTPITKTEMRPEQKVEMIDGAAVMVTTEVPHEVPQYDEFPITDGTGQPVLELVSAATEDADAVYKQAVHKVAKMKVGKKVSATKKKRLAKLLATG